MYAGRSHPTCASDVFAFATLVFELYSGFSPFASRSPISAVAALTNGERPGRDEVHRHDLSDLVWSLITACWAQEPFLRPAMGDVLTLLTRV
ncbi:hypothetical protein EXIGLDRAFT_731634 [Exidia glandulosa HHB12029]|uniref:Protein kinase domain-containing protein n=1 Tax=Exidia glandulosa HHB12029 TaxID=1314781 RepID=A0A165KZ08_EXIGL|nr:hypothetical protein EXIGLDRAFT_731634 [Exidia glandulosa HHB12029]